MFYTHAYNFIRIVYIYLPPLNNSNLEHANFEKYFAIRAVYIYLSSRLYRYQSAVRFKSSSGKDLKLKESCDITDQFKRRCSASNSHVWLTTPVQDPDYTTKGVQVRDLCMRTGRNDGLLIPLDLKYCKCDRKQLMLVQQCVDVCTSNTFLVYRLSPLFLSDADDVQAKSCAIRYCVTGKDEGNDL